LVYKQEKVWRLGSKSPSFPHPTQTSFSLISFSHSLQSCARCSLHSFLIQLLEHIELCSLFHINYFLISSLHDLFS
ncbi:uncharacterized protein PgNI_03972, partial [Pyricularia grisea]|uniref:Uncharacterized protein n=1 Tax=Pyricularia grisea TaxID=148305 RepID=A0A6P8BDB9_PYRGI